MGRISAIDGRVFDDNKYAISSNRAAVEGLKNLHSNYFECESKQEILQNIAEFMNKQSLFLNLIANKQIDCEEFGQIVNRVKEKVGILNEALMVPILNCELERTPFSCSQNSSEAYVTRLHDADASAASVSCNFHQDVRQSVQIQNSQIYPPGELIDFPSSEELDTEVLSRDTREIPDEYPLKRGIIVRLSSRPGGTYCCQSLDFGYKLAKGIQFLFKVPPELVGKPPTVFNCKMMGIKPVSGFTFTDVFTENACSVMRRLAKITNYKVYIRRYFKVPDKYDTIFCHVVCLLCRTRLDWSEKLISSKVAIEFKDSNQCFRPREDYCYLHHVLNGCIQSECYKNHSCQFCPDNANSNRLKECEAYIEAEKQLLME
uniref:Uncharacterized protein n=1 Tax=Tetranychus urticae TaxID=32264 RepID=T1JZP3_TETUR